MKFPLIVRLAGVGNGNIVVNTESELANCISIVIREDATRIIIEPITLFACDHGERTPYVTSSDISIQSICIVCCSLLKQETNA